MTTDKFLLYDSLSQYYDAIEGRIDAVKSDIPFLNEIFENEGVLRVLDVGCGTGLHADLLSRRGYDMVGIDNSPAMLEVAKRRSGDVVYLGEDMRDFDFEEKFDAAISMYGSINYLLEDEGIEAAFRCVRRSLRRDGVFILEVWNAVPLLMKLGKDEALDASIDHGSTSIVRRKGYRLQKGEGVKVRVEYSYTITQETMETVSESHLVRSFFVKEIERLLGRCGFRSLQVYNSTSDRGVFEFWSNRMVILAQVG